LRAPYQIPKVDPDNILSPTLHFLWIVPQSASKFLAINDLNRISMCR